MTRWLCFEDPHVERRYDLWLGANNLRVCVSNMILVGIQWTMCCDIQVFDRKSSSLLMSDDDGGCPTMSIIPSGATPGTLDRWLAVEHLFWLYRAMAPC